MKKNILNFRVYHSDYAVEGKNVVRHGTYMFLVACYATLYVGRSVDRSVRHSVRHTYTFGSFFDSFVSNYVNSVSN